MRNITDIFSVQNDLPVELRYIRAAAYCRVSTELEATSSIELQERYYSHLISGKPIGKMPEYFWESHRSEFERAA